MADVAELFMHDGDQAVRLPDAYRFNIDVKEVFIRRDPKTGDIILSRREDDWAGPVVDDEGVELPPGFVSAEEQALGVREVTEERHPLADWEE
ncbi:MAG: AbrB/MazE/SpoVT family DNA-binding domain-containing protein [Azospirillaceae bacterium]|nr:AbrB/MazE/SpoVT family DNA-binding domain-containing protein [Azospirillaceae bacterium]